MQQSEGVFLQIISGVDRYGDEFDHVVVIDAVARETIDCRESHMLRLEWRVIRQCVGKDNFRGVFDSRRPHQHKLGSQTRRSRRNSKPTANQIAKKKRQRVKDLHVQIHHPIVGTIPNSK